MLKDSPVGGTLAVRDLAVAKEFYEGKLGLTPSEKFDSDQGTMYECGTGTGFLVYVSVENARTNKATVLTWMVTDVAACVAALREKGVVFEDYDQPGIKTEDGIASQDGWKAAWFKDPDENILCITQM